VNPHTQDAQEDDREPASRLPSFDLLSARLDELWQQTVHAEIADVVFLQPLRYIFELFFVEQPADATAALPLVRPSLVASETAEILARPLEPSVELRPFADERLMRDLDLLVLGRLTGGPPNEPRA
jgi:hypothetical protein